MNRGRASYIPDPYDLNPGNKRYEKSRNFPSTLSSQRSTSKKDHQKYHQQDDDLENVDSEEEETYLQKDKHGKMSNYFRSNENVVETHSKPQKVVVGEKDDTKERLARLETILEQLVNKEKIGSKTPPPPPVSKNKRDVFIPPPSASQKEKSDVEFPLEPRNHHFTTSMWINKIQEISIRNNYTEKQTIQFMEKQMSGIIKAWYKSLPTYDFTWPEWKLLITKTFPDNDDFITTLKRLVTRIKQSNETITNYYYSKMYLIEACKIQGEDAVSCLIDGLNNHIIQAEAKAQNYLTPETLCSQYLMNLPDYQVDYPPQPQPQLQQQQPQQQQQQQQEGFQPPLQGPQQFDNNLFYVEPQALQLEREQFEVHQIPQQQHLQPPDYPINDMGFNNNFNNGMHFEPAPQLSQPDYDERLERMDRLEERPPVHSRLGGRNNNPTKHRRHRSGFKAKPINRRLV